MKRYYATPRRREEVDFTDALREATIKAAEALHALFASGVTPPAEYSRKKCDRCSLLGSCLPAQSGKGAQVADYLRRMLAAGEGE